MTQGFWWPKCKGTPPTTSKGASDVRGRGHQEVRVENIVTRFRVLEYLVSNNDLQFDSKSFHKYCNDLGTKNRYSIPAYPQSNSQAKPMNKVIVNGLKKRLEGTKGSWTKELPNVLWAYRTTPRRSTGETPYFLTYGAEAVILAEVSLHKARVLDFSLATNEELMLKQLDSLEECQEAATICLADYQ
ncbi:uncharacterized protein LOC142639434 [Castanea sativa]|uniref:uncharacterized protein LOC142639434 n=1 Tax=Castanea sativa TaxID=21020 RepID=UPI003F654042